MYDELFKIFHGEKSKDGAVITPSKILCFLNGEAEFKICWELGQFGALILASGLIRSGFYTANVHITEDSLSRATQASPKRIDGKAIFNAAKANLREAKKMLPLYNKFYKGRSVTGTPIPPSGHTEADGNEYILTEFFKQNYQKSAAGTEARDSDEEAEEYELAKNGVASIEAPDAIPKGWPVFFVFGPGATNADGTSNSSSLLCVGENAPGPTKDQGRASVRKEAGERASAGRTAGDTDGKPGARGTSSKEAAIFAQNAAAAHQHDIDMRVLSLNNSIAGNEAKGARIVQTMTVKYFADNPEKMEGLVKALEDVDAETKEMKVELDELTRVKRKVLTPMVDFQVSSAVSDANGTSESSATSQEKRARPCSAPPVMLSDALDAARTTPTERNKPADDIDITP